MFSLHKYFFDFLHKCTSYILSLCLHSERYYPIIIKPNLWFQITFDSSNSFLIIWTPSHAWLTIDFYTFERKKKIPPLHLIFKLIAKLIATNSELIWFSGSVKFLKSHPQISLRLTLSNVNSPCINLCSKSR